MAIDCMLADMPAGVATVCLEWFDEDCPADDALVIAALPGRQRPHNEAALVWIKSRLLERGVLRGWAVARGIHDGTPPDYETPKPLEMTPEQLKKFKQKLLWGGPPHLGYARSAISRSPLMITPINAVADRVTHFDDQRPCPYCNRWFRNGGALRLHVIDNHLYEWQERPCRQ